VSEPGAGTSRPVPPEPAGAAGAGEPATPADAAAGPAETADDLRSQVAEAQDQRLRALADADNARKRCAAQVSRAEAEATAWVARQWLPVVDNLERALQHSGAGPDAIIEGVRAVRDQAQGVLAALGFPRRDDDAGAPFDPARHDAIAARPDPQAPAGTVIEVTRPAYGDGDHQLRPAQVVVARAG
jgi:molecular chaperone GrpE